MEKEYVLLPTKGARAKTFSASRILVNMPAIDAETAPPITIDDFADGLPITVIDNLMPDGPKLVKATENLAALVNASSADARMEEVVNYKLPGTNHSRLSTSAARTLSRPSGHYYNFTFKCVSLTTGREIPRCEVIAYTDLSTNAGNSGYTDNNGEITLQLAALNIQKLLVISTDPSFWGDVRNNLAIDNSGFMEIQLKPASPNDVDAISSYYPQRRFDIRTDITVGVIDTGVHAHSDLNLVGGFNTVKNQRNRDYSDYDNHGTHVAGIIGANGSGASGRRGVAPGCRIWGGRVFDDNGDATNFSILKAVILAAVAECDILNLSLGGGDSDPIVKDAFEDCNENGVLAVIAAGNDGREAVSFPAAYDSAIAVSAMGNEGFIPPDTIASLDILRPPVSTKDTKEYIASFSNVGTQIDVTGLGTGIISTLRTGGYGQMSGTSMSAPFIAGCAASLLSRNPDVFNMSRGPDRARAIGDLLKSNCIKRGFGRTFEGYGLPDPDNI